MARVKFGSAKRRLIRQLTPDRQHQVLGPVYAQPQSISFLLERLYGVIWLDNHLGLLEALGTEYPTALAKIVPSPGPLTRHEMRIKKKKKQRQRTRIQIVCVQCCLVICRCSLLLTSDLAWYSVRLERCITK